MRQLASKFMSRALSCKTGLQSKFCVVQGLQWGQEGKKKLLHVLAPDYDYSCRFNGSKSSEPSVLKDGSQLWLLPEGLTNETGIKCILGNGVVVDP
mmetsp:Transcript_2392/g.3043  ORF Transcript_2392/g.3043 Transcript_2392/m.3043 type:complete len:96 (+) Transcript_2392:36-323(+)